MSAELSDAEARVLNYLRSRAPEQPTYAEIAAALGWKSTRMAGYCLEGLERKGFVVRQGQGRGAALVQPAPLPWKWTHGKCPSADSPVRAAG